MESKNVYPATSIAGLEKWIRRRGVGVDILGLDAEVKPVKAERLIGRWKRARGPWLSVLGSIDYSRLFSNDDMSLAKQYYETVLSSVLKKLNPEKQVSLQDLVKKYNESIESVELRKNRYIEDFNTFREKMRRAGFVWNGYTNVFSPQVFLRSPSQALQALRELEGYPVSVELVLRHGGSRLVGPRGFIDILRSIWGGDLENYVVSGPSIDFKPYRDDPNYYALPAYMMPRELVRKVQDRLTYTYRVYDRDLHEMVDRERRVWRWGKDERGRWLILVPRGMVYAIYRFLRDNGVNVKLHPYAVWIAENLWDKPLGGVVKTLRPYQLEAEAKMLEYLSMNGGATLWAATGAGKTEVAIDLISRLLPLLEKGLLNGKRKVYFLATTKDLVYQFAERCKKYGIPVGVVTGDEFDLDKPVVAVTVQSLYKALQKYKELSEEEKKELRGLSDKPEEGVRLDEVPLKEQQKRLLADDYVNNAGLVVFDEVQHVPAKTIRYTVLANKDALRVGLSATPWRDDDHDMLIYASIGSIVDRKITSSELIARGFLVPPFIFMVEYSDPVEREKDEELRWARGNRYTEVRRTVYFDEYRNKYIASVAKYLVEKGYKPVLVLVEFKDHGKVLRDAMREAGINVEFIHGELSGKRRRKLLKDIREGRLDVLIGTTVADEGLDIPNLKSLMIVRAGKSRVKAFQRIGRVIRRYPGKDRAIVIDIADDIKYLRDHAERRYEMYRSEPLWFVKKVLKNNVYRAIDEAIVLPHDRLMDIIKAKYDRVVEGSYT